MVARLVFLQKSPAKPASACLEDHRGAANATSLPVLDVCISLALLQITPSRAEANSGTWDVAEFNGCFGSGRDDLDRILGPEWTIQDLREHHAYCCRKSGGRLSGNQCVAPPSSAASSFAPSLGKVGDSVSSGRLEEACLAVDGLFFESSRGGGYSCTKHNCDRKDGNCMIACGGDRQCLALTPSQINSPLTLFGILQNGDNVNRSRSEASSSSSDGGAPEQPPPVFY